MADVRLRGLERWERPDLGAQVRLVTERLRAGALSQARVRLAALCGSEIAAHVVEHDCGAAQGLCFRCGHELSILEGLAGLGGDEASTRAAIAATRCMQAQWDGLVREIGWDALSERAWGRGHHVPCPGPLPGSWSELTARVERGLAEAEGLVREGLLASPGEDALACRRGLYADYLRSGFDLRWTCFPLDMALGQRPTWASFYTLAQAELLDAIARELVPWALGFADPLEERSAGRGEAGG